jgi:homeobox protein cut-like
MNGSAKTGQQDSLEQLLLARNKKLSDEMAVMRVSLQELKRDLEQSQENASVANAELERVQHLNTTLENDLQTLQNESANQFSVGRSIAGSRHPASSWGRGAGRRSSPTSSIISGFDSSSRVDTPGSGDSGVYGGGSGMLPLVQAQRDRFKQKISQLESELSKQYSTVSSLRQEVQSLQKDNLNLYERTRYVSTYQRSVPGGASSSSYAAAPPSSTVPLADANTSSGLTLDRYRSAYEASLSPFAAFRGREASRAVRRLTLPERVAYNIMRVVLASRTSRNLFALYCVALHLLVFMMLYWMGNADVSKHASNLGDAALGAAAGGAAVGGVNGLGGNGELHHGEWHQEGVEGVTGH